MTEYEVIHEERGGVCIGCEQFGEPVEWLLAEARGHSDEREHAAASDAHEVSPEWVPVCSVCWEPVHQDADEKWVHTRATPPATT